MKLHRINQALRRAIYNATRLERAGEPFPDIARCISAGQSAASLAASTSAALRDLGRGRKGVGR